MNAADDTDTLPTIDVHARGARTAIRTRSFLLLLLVRLLLLRLRPSVCLSFPFPSSHRSSSF